LPRREHLLIFIYSTVFSVLAHNPQRTQSVSTVKNLHRYRWAVISNVRFVSDFKENRYELTNFSKILNKKFTNILRWELLSSMRTDGRRDAWRG